MAGARIGVMAERQASLARAWQRDMRATFSGPCTAETARCADAVDPRALTPACCLGHIRDIAAFVFPLLAEHGISAWLDYGSLLGYMRNPLIRKPPGILANDKDGDAGFLEQDWQRFESLKPEVESAGFEMLVKEVRGGRLFAGGHSIKIRRSSTNHTNIDFFPWYECDGLFPPVRRRNMGAEAPARLLDRKRYIGADRYKGREVPIDKILPLGIGEWEGLQLPIPADPEWLVSYRYGVAPDNPWGYEPEPTNWKTDIDTHHDGRLR